MFFLTLIFLLQAQLVFSQSAAALSLNQVHEFPPGSPTLFAIPPSASNVSVSVAVCSDSNSFPRFFVSNDSRESMPNASEVEQEGFTEMNLEDGFAQWMGMFTEGGYLAVTNAGQVAFEIGLSQGGAMYNWTDSLPLLGDTTNNQVLLFSPPLFDAPSTDTPTYPNYKLPDANLSQPSPNALPKANISLFLAPTAELASVSLPRTGCAFRDTRITNSRYINNTGNIWLKDSEGWRWQWFVNGLSPATNYTAYTIINGTQVSGPINFVTKSAAFQCPIVHSLPYCPSVAYAVPIAAPPGGGAVPHTSQTLSADIVNPLLETLTNFTISLTSFPCGRDEYSLLVSCADCQEAYRKWLCTIWFPRCADSSPPPTSDAQVPLGAMQAQPASATPRSPGLPPFQASYNAFLPCLETCTAVDRACPVSLGFRCPVPRFNARASYAVGFIDTGEEGEQGGGITGAAQDRYGNVWCNAG